MRWLVALVAETGIRLAEGAGLLRSDFITKDGILCVGIKPHLAECCSGDTCETDHNLAMGYKSSY